MLCHKFIVVKCVCLISTLIQIDNVIGTLDVISCIMLFHPGCCYSGYVGPLCNLKF